MGKKSLSARVLASVCSLVVFSGAAIGTTVALFTSKKEVRTHLQIGGPLKAGLYLTKLTQDVLTDEGMIESREADLRTYQTSGGESAYDESHGGVDLALYDKDLAFFDGIVPTMTGRMEFALFNKGDIAFSFAVEDSFGCYDGEGKEVADDSLKGQVAYRVEAEDGSNLVKAGESKKIELSYEFLNREDNNDVMGYAYTIDFTVNVVQVTKQG